MAPQNSDFLKITSYLGVSQNNNNTTLSRNFEKLCEVFYFEKYHFFLMVAEISFRCTVLKGCRQKKKKVPTY